MIEILVGDITKLEVDAIVNAANSTLLGGGGVDGAIHAAAGPLLQDYCRTLKGCRCGEAKLSPGFDLPARRIIHTVGPVWKDGTHYEAALLKACYRSSFSWHCNTKCAPLPFRSSVPAPMVTRSKRLQKLPWQPCWRTRTVSNGSLPVVSVSAMQCYICLPCRQCAGPEKRLRTATPAGVPGW